MLSQVGNNGLSSLVPRPLSLVAYWVHDLDPVIFQFTDTLAIRWYGLAYVTGFLVAFGLFGLYWRRGRSLLPPASQENFAIALIIGVVVGGRLGYFLLYELHNLLRDPLVLFRVWEGGMASHGGFLGVAGAVLYTARRYRIPALHLGDLVVSVTAAGLMLGRIGNFINGQLWGKVSEVPWAVIFPKSAPYGMPVELIAPRHPSQLYQAGLEGLLLFAYMQWRFWSVPRREGESRDKPARYESRDKPARYGHLTGEFLIGYSVARLIGEFFREPDAALILGMSRGSFYSLFLFAAGVGLLTWIRRGHLTNR